MSLRYLCEDCQKELKTNFKMEAINEVGRKHCDRCGNNKDNLYILGEYDFNKLRGNE